MTEFSKNELLRLVDMIPETDPTTTAYHVLMQSIECYNSLALTVDEIIALRDGEAHDDLAEQQEMVKQQAEKVKEIAQDNVIPFNAPDFPAEPAPAPKAEAKVSAADARKKLVEARAKGINVKDVLSGFGVENFQQLPADKYEALADALEALL